MYKLQTWPTLEEPPNGYYSVYGGPSPSTGGWHYPGCPAYSVYNVYQYCLQTSWYPFNIGTNEPEWQLQCQGGRNKWRRRRRPKTYVNMPSGGFIAVTIPAKPCGCTNCAFTVNRIPLQPSGRYLWKREYNIVVNEMNSTIRQQIVQEHGGGRFTSYQIVSVHKIQNNCLWKRFIEKERQVAWEAGYVNEKMLFHGTTATAADTIINTGFDKQYAKPSGMFGTGIYFAEHSSKSNQFTYGPLGGNGCQLHSDKNCYSCVRKMLLCRVALGKMCNLQTWTTLEEPPTGFHSVYGEPSPSTGGVLYPIYAVYNVDQVYPEYLIEYKIVQ